MKLTTKDWRDVLLLSSIGDQTGGSVQHHLQPTNGCCWRDLQNCVAVVNSSLSGMPHLTCGTSFFLYSWFYLRWTPHTLYHKSQVSVKGVPRFYDQISVLSKSCYSYSRIRPDLDLKLVSTIDTSVVHSKLDYCNSLYDNLTNYQINWLQRTQNSVDRATVKVPNPSNVRLVRRSLHWMLECLKSTNASNTSWFLLLTNKQPLNPLHLHPNSPVLHIFPTVYCKMCILYCVFLLYHAYTVHFM